MTDEQVVRELCKKDKDELNYYKGVIEALILKHELEK